MFGVAWAIGGGVGWEVARRAKKAAAKPAEEALAELREREKQLRKELEVRERTRSTEKNQNNRRRPSVCLSLCSRTHRERDCTRATLRQDVVPLTSHRADAPNAAGSGARPNHSIRRRRRRRQTRRFFSFVPPPLKRRPCLSLSLLLTLPHSQTPPIRETTTETNP
jgi:hypothetical protein